MMLYIIQPFFAYTATHNILSGYSADGTNTKWSILALCPWKSDQTSSLAAGAICRHIHILPTTACLAWLVPRSRRRTKVPSLHALINHSRYTSQARIATNAAHIIHTHITRIFKMPAISSIKSSCPGRVSQTTSVRNN